MGLEKCHIFSFVQRQRADVNPRRVKMCRRQMHTFGKAFFTDDRQRNPLCTVDLINPVARLELLPTMIGDKACLFCTCNHFLYRVTLGL